MFSGKKKNIFKANLTIKVVLRFKIIRNNIIAIFNNNVIIPNFFMGAGNGMNKITSQNMASSERLSNSLSNTIDAKIDDLD